MNGLHTQIKLQHAVRYLRENNLYCLDRRVEKREERKPILTQWKEAVQAQRNG